MTPEPRRIPDALLERYLADALSEEAKARLESTLAASPGDQARLAELRADSAAFLLQHPPGPLVARFQKERRRAKWWNRSLLLVPFLAGAAAAAVVMPLLSPTVQPPLAEEPYTPKGPVVLVLYRKTGDSSEKIAPDGAVAPQDSIRFEVKTDSSGFVAIISRDPQGALTVYYPFGGSAAAPYNPAQPVLPGAIQLDDTLGHEDIYALYSARPFDVAWALQALKAGHRLEEAAPKGISVGHASFEKVKAGPPQK